jgi:hypothetical protein
MVQEAIHTIVERLNQFALKKTGKTKFAQVESLNETNLTPDKILVTLVGVEEDRVSANKDYYHAEEQKYLVPEIRVNLMLLLSASHADYEQKLKELAIVLLFFQTTPFIKNATEGIKKLTFELQTLTFEQQSYIWGLFTAKYMPAVVYRVRVVVLKDREVLGEGTPITEIDIVTASK